MVAEQVGGRICAGSHGYAGAAGIVVFHHRSGAAAHIPLEVIADIGRGHLAYGGFFVPVSSAIFKKTTSFEPFSRKSNSSR
jgi:hypothetical protein